MMEQLTESELQQRHSQARLQRGMLPVSMGLGQHLGDIPFVCILGPARWCGRAAYGGGVATWRHSPTILLHASAAVWRIYGSNAQPLVWWLLVDRDMVGGNLVGN